MEHFLEANHHALLRSRVVKNEVRTDRHTDGHEYVGADEPKMEGKNGAVVWGRGVKKVRFDLRLGGSPIGRLKSRVCKGFRGQKEGADDCSNTREKWSSLRSLPTRLSADEPQKESSLFFISVVCPALPIVQGSEESSLCLSLRRRQERRGITSSAFSS